MSGPPNTDYMEGPPPAPYPMPGMLVEILEVEYKIDEVDLIKGKVVLRRVQ